MVEPTGYTALDLIGFTDKGPYDPTANYVRNDLVHVGNSTWRCKIDDTTGITPTEGANWTIFIESATSLAGMSDVDLNTPKAGDGLVHDGNDWTNIPIMTKEQWKKNGAYNLYNHNLQTQVVNTGGGSVTVTVNRTVGSPDYGTFSIVGTIGSATDIVVGALDSNVFKAGQKYKLTGCPSGGAASTYNIRITGAGVEDHGDGVEFTATGSDQMKIQLRGASINATFKPMITTDLNATYDDYQPYAMTNRELTESAIFGNLTRISNPSVTLSMADATKTVNITKPYKMYLLVLAYNGSYKSTLLFPNGLNYYIDGNPTNSNYNSTVEASVNSTNDTATIHLVQIKGWTTAVCDIYGIS